jgi:hypothetical protein
MALYIDDLGSGSNRYLILLENANPQLTKLNWNSLPGGQSIFNIPAGLRFYRLGTLVGTDFVKGDYMDLDIGENGFPNFPFSATAKFAFHCFNNQNTEPDLAAKLKGFQFKYEFFISDTAQVLGQKHDITNSDVTHKNLVERTVFIDDSPRFLAKGTMYRIVSGAKVKTTTWAAQRSATPGDFVYRYGELNQLNELQLRGVTRIKLDGDFLGLISYSDLCEFPFYAGKYFNPGRISIDLKNEQVSGTFFEVSSADAEPASAYNFNFIYKTLLG